MSTRLNGFRLAGGRRALLRGLRPPRRGPLAPAVRGPRRAVVVRDDARAGLGRGLGHAARPPAPDAGSSVGWYPLISSLGADRRVYTPGTIGGAGRSVRIEPITNGEDLVRWLDELLDRLEIDGVHLAGYSEGGWIAGLHAALTRRPEHLVSLTLIEPAGAIERVPGRFLAGMVVRGARDLIARDKRAAVDRLNRWMNGDVELTDAQFELLEAAMGPFRQKLPAPPRPAPRRLPDDQLRRITVPTLLLLGADTKLYDPERVRDRALALLPRVDVEIIPDAGHSLAFQHPDLVTTKLGDHLRATERAS